MSKLPETLTIPVLPLALPGFGQRVCATVMAIDLIGLLVKCDEGQYNREVATRAWTCLNHELAALARHKTTIVWA